MTTDSRKTGACADSETSPGRSRQRNTQVLGPHPRFGQRDDPSLANSRATASLDFKKAIRKHSSANFFAELYDEQHRYTHTLGDLATL